MTKKDFELIAGTISALTWSPVSGGHGLTNDQRFAVALRFADALAATNSAFNRARFLAACTADR